MSLDKLSILNGLSHVLGKYKYGHMKSEDKEEEKKIGLQRDAGHPVLDKRVNDGFSVKVVENNLFLCYHFDGLDVKDFHNHNIVEECEKSISEVRLFLEKEFKNVAEKALGLKKEGDMDLDIYNINRHRIAGYAVQKYTVSGLEESGATDLVDPIRKATIDFITMSRDVSKPSNVTRKQDGFKVFNPAKLQAGIRK